MHVPLARPHPGRPHPPAWHDLADGAGGHHGHEWARPPGADRDDHGDRRAEQTCPRTRNHDPGTGHPAGTRAAGDHGISHVSAAVLLAEIGDITRFSSSAKLARYTGSAPLLVYSSDKERYRLHRGGNRRLNSVLYTTSIVQQRFHPGARALLARHEPTKGARGARRILKRHLIDVIHRAMTQDRVTWQHHITQHQLAA
ncbi:IS110 family transposase [Streptomyces bobili]|uniref:IS110 family transposase n=1 Tax=Streptomyces bobili TaxID=67280 RepID=UPI003421FD54